MELVEPHRLALRLLCYRMLGSSHDAEDVLQEALVRAWSARESLADPSRLRPWLYRITTNVCLRALRDKPRRALPSDLIDPADPHQAIMPAAETPWLEPYPARWVAGIAAEPGATYELKESISLAFVALLQTLSAVQRAALLLRDVLGFSAAETAEALELSVSAANSALFRARTAMEMARSDDIEREVDEALVASYLRAFEDGDVDALVQLLRHDVKTTMPPSPTWIDGIEANTIFYRNMFAKQDAGALRLVATVANLQPALGFYRRSSPAEPYRLRAIEVLGIRGERIERIDHFMSAAVLRLFSLPPELPPKH